MGQVNVVGGKNPLTVTDPDEMEYIRLSYPYLKKADNGSWRDFALCKGQPDLLSKFFVEGGTKSRPRSMVVAEVKFFYCDNCAVRKNCFQFAKDNDMRHGVWGGVDFFVSRDGRAPIPDSID